MTEPKAPRRFEEFDGDGATLHGREAVLPKPDWPAPAAFTRAAALIGCEEAMLFALAQIEAAAEGAFLPSGEPPILFERHVFSRLTSGRHDGATVPGVVDVRHTPWALISWPTRTPAGGYGPRSVQHRRLQAAVLLDRTAALSSASWGMFQIMGENYRRCGFAEVQDFINAMYLSADAQLLALTAYVLWDKRLVQAMREKDFPTASERYNGTGYRRDKYHLRWAAAYAEAVGEAGLRA